MILWIYERLAPTVAVGLIGPEAHDNRQLVRHLVLVATQLQLQLGAIGHPTDLMAGVIEDRLVTFGYDRAGVRRHTDIIRDTHQQIEAIRAKEVVVRVRREELSDGI